MPRRLIVKRAEIYKRRSMYWERHYEARQMAQCMNVQHAYICSILRAELPAPVLDIDGAVVWFPLDVRQGLNSLYFRLKLPRTPHEFALSWYWSESDWMNFVRQFQALPEPTEDYYYYYDSDNDVAQLIPMSATAKRGGVDNPVDKSGTSKAFEVQVRSKSGSMVGY